MILDQCKGAHCVDLGESFQTHILNYYFLAKFRFDTAENEPAKNLQNFAIFANFANPTPEVRDKAQQLRGARERREEGTAASAVAFRSAAAATAAAPASTLPRAASIIVFIVV